MSSHAGRNDDDEYDFEDAQIVDSNLTEDIGTCFVGCHARELPLGNPNKVK